MNEVQEAILKDRFFHPHEKDWFDVAERTARSWGTTPEEVASIYQMIRDKKALPNTPALANAGRPNQMGSACYVLPISDSLTEGPESIMQTLKDAAAVHKSGGGTGFSFGRIRGRGTTVSSTGRPAPGAVNVLELYSDAIARVTQAGMRPGANMGILPVEHPDVMEFVHCKNREGGITNFNISVALSDAFMETITHPDGGPAWVHEVWDAIVDGAWRNGEPGVFFIDTANKTRLHPEEFEATNPCGEVPLRPYEACVLGSIDLSKHVKYEDWGGMTATVIDWEALADTTHTLVTLLDNIIDLQTYPIPEIEREQKRYRKIGVGVMGYADLLIMLGLRYGSSEAIALADVVMGFIRRETYEASEILAFERGVYPGFHEDARNREAGFHMPFRRNLCTTVIAPTGTISRLAGCSFGIEPPFGAEYDSFVVGGMFHEKHPLRESPYFVTTMDVTPEQHVLTQAAFQRHCDQAVSKTVNLPYRATHQDVADIYTLAWKMGCKGITVLREASREDVVIGTADCTGAACRI